MSSAPKQAYSENNFKYYGYNLCLYGVDPGCYLKPLLAKDLQSAVEEYVEFLGHGEAGVDVSCNEFKLYEDNNVIASVNFQHIEDFDSGIFVVGSTQFFKTKGAFHKIAMTQLMGSGDHDITLEESKQKKLNNYMDKKKFLKEAREYKPNRNDCPSCHEALKNGKCQNEDCKKGKGHHIFAKKEKHSEATVRENTAIVNFIHNVTQKNYSEANKYLHAAVNEKLKARIKQCASVSIF